MRPTVTPPAAKSSPNPALPAVGAEVREVFGHRFTAFLPLPAPIVAPGPVDWRFTLGDAGAMAEDTARLIDDLQPAGADAFEAGGFARVAFADGGIVLQPRAGVAVSDLGSVITGSLVALLLGRAGQFVLHGSTVRFGEKVVLLCGSAGAGKSTLAAHLATHGAALHADDVAPIVWRDDTPAVFPGFEGLRLTPAAFALLGLDPARAAPVHSRTAKRLATFAPPRTEPGRALPLAGIVFLDEAPGFAAGPLAGSASIVTLLNLQHPTAAHAFDASPTRRAAALHAAARLAGKVRLVRILREKTPANLARCAEAILAACALG